MNAPLTLEEQYWSQGRLVVGTDEAGRGCLCGPVTAAAVVFSPWAASDSNDSKKLSPSQRETICNKVQVEALGSCISSRSAKRIDDINILQASLEAMKDAVLRVIRSCKLNNPIVLVDGNRAIPELGYEQVCITKGDQKSRTIAAASVLAKCRRDEYMIALDQITGCTYGLSQHKGYPSQLHYRALERFGPSEYHRTSFRLDGGYRKKSSTK